MCGYLISSDSPCHVHLSGNRCGRGACEYRLEWPVFGYIPCNAACLSDAYKHINIIVEGNTACSGRKCVCGAQLLGILNCIRSHIIIYLLIVKDILALSNTLSQLDSRVNWVFTD
jgi:hypothetical protein